MSSAGVASAVGGATRVGAGRRPRAVRRPLRRPAALWRHRRAVRLLVGRDLRVRYADTALGYVWSVLEPLMLAAVYWFVFTQVFVRTVGQEPYIVFLLAGLLPWTWFNAGVSDAARSLRAEAKLVRSVRLPRELWVARVVLSKGVEYLFSLPVLAAFALFSSARLSWELALLPLAMLIQAVLVLGVGLLLAPLTVLARDLERVVRIALRFGFYATPIIYAVDDVPEPWRVLSVLNPMSGIIELTRAGFFPGQVDWWQVGSCAITSALVLAVGWVVFSRLERTVLKEE